MVFDSHDHTHNQQQRKKRRNKIILYVVLFAIVQFAVIAVFATTVMKVRTPRFRIHSATFDNFNVGSQANTTFRARMNTQFIVKNTNFGRYRFENTTVQFAYRGTPIGEALMTNSRVGWRTTRRVNVGVDLSLANVSGGGILSITCQARMRGRAEIIFVMKKNRATNLNCSMDVVLATQQVNNIVCH